MANVSEKMESERIEHRRVGIIVNPLAGMGGKVGLKGTDGESVFQLALSRGARPEASLRMFQALEMLKISGTQISIVTCQGAMGEEAVVRAGFTPETVLGIGGVATTSSDTIQAVLQMNSIGVDLLLFAGGDGTARDIAFAHRGADPVIGIPAGVKMQSAVFSRTPNDGGKLASDWLCGKVNHTSEAEVVDLDEALYREGVISTHFYGVLPVPEDRRRLQGKKCRTGDDELESQRSIAWEVIRQMRDQIYLVGPGTTTRALLSRLGQEGTLIGVDALRDKKIIARDLSESEILDLIEGCNVKLLLTPIGGQGFLLGRGNQQISPRVLELVGKENIIVVATKNKLQALNGSPLRVDTGNEEMNLKLSGYIRIITGIKEEMIYPIKN